MTNETNYKKQIEALVEDQKQMVAKHGWYSHGVIPQADENGAYNYMNTHTHHVGETFNHPNLQVALNIGTQLTQSILHTVVDKIREGTTFQDGDTDDDVIENYPVLFKSIVRAEDPEESLLRIIFPDANGKFPGDEGCNPVYDRQADVDLFEEDAVND